MTKLLHAVLFVVTVLPIAACQRSKAENPVATHSLPDEVDVAAFENKCQGPGVDCTAENYCCADLTCTQQKDGVFRCMK